MVGDKTMKDYSESKECKECEHRRADLCNGCAITEYLDCGLVERLEKENEDLKSKLRKFEQMITSGVLK